MLLGDPSYYYYYYYGANFPSSVGIGQSAHLWVGPSTFAPLPSPLTVSLSHVGAPHITLPSSVTIPTGGTFSQFQITGTSAGTDTIVASAPGYSAATVSISVGLGTIDLSYGGGPYAKVSATNEVFVCALSPDEGQVSLVSPARRSRHASPDISLPSPQHGRYVVLIPASRTAVFAAAGRLSRFWAALPS
jgi:hypothetical protein